MGVVWKQSREDRGTSVRVRCAIDGQGLATTQTNGTYIHSHRIKPFKNEPHKQMARTSTPIESNLSKTNQTLPEASFEVHQILFFPGNANMDHHCKALISTKRTLNQCKE
jgi:hypothetical protein